MPLQRRRSPRASRPRIHGSSRASRSARPCGGRGSCRSSDWRVSRSASATFSAASSVQPPANTLRRAKSACSSGREQLVRPLDRRPERLLASVRVAPSLEQVEALSEPVEQLLGAEHRRARGGELDRERQVVEPPAQLLDRRRPARRGPARRTASTPSSGTSGGSGYSRSPLTRSSSRLVTSMPRFGHAASSARQLGRGLDHVLEVVEQDEHPLVGDVLGEARRSRPRPGRPSRARAPDRAAARAAPRRRRPGTGRAAGRELDREARLPGAARPGHRQQARARAEELADLGELRARGRGMTRPARGRFVFEIVFSGGNSPVAELEQPRPARRSPSTGARRDRAPRSRPPARASPARATPARRGLRSSPAPRGERRGRRTSADRGPAPRYADPSAP